MPKEARNANSAKSTASHFIPSPFSRMYIVPPLHCPSSSFSRYLTASVTSQNFVVIPKIAEKSIQTNAPGPPRCRAVATPAIFPVPTVAARAVAIAAKDEILPSSELFSLILPRTSLIISPKYLTCGKPRISVSQIPVPTNRVSIHGPQTIPFMMPLIFHTASIKIPPQKSKL